MGKARFSGISVSVGLHWFSSVTVGSREMYLIHMRKVDKISIQTVYQQNRRLLSCLMVYFLCDQNWHFFKFAKI